MCRGDLQADNLHLEYSLAKMYFVTDVRMRYCAMLLPIAGRWPLLPPGVVSLVADFLTTPPTAATSAWISFDGVFAPDSNDPVIPQDAGHHMRQEFPAFFSVTRQQEFYQLIDQGGVSDNIHLFNEKLREWEDYYNYDRPHGALQGRTPYERLIEKSRAVVSPGS